VSNNITLLNDLAQQINDANTAAAGSFKEGLSHAIRAGQLLIEAKRHHQHGDWRDWMAKNLTFSERTAQGYMQVSRNAERLGQNRNAVADFSLRQAMKQIAVSTGRIAKLPPKTVVKALDKGDDDKTQAELKQAGNQQRYQQNSAQTEPIAEAVGNVEGGDNVHIFDRMFGPLSGAEWVSIGEGCWSRPIFRGPHKRPGRYSDAFLKLATHFSVPLAELEAAE
jgi:hypothetical protein